MNTGVYSITNLTNGKMYIGSVGSSRFRHRNFGLREREHLKLLRDGKHYNTFLQNAYNKSGESNMKFEILEECLPEFCVSTEQWWINMLQSANAKFGYNIRPKSNGQAGVRLSAETRKKLSMVRIGNKNGLGTKHTKEHCDKIGLRFRGKKQNWVQVERRAMRHRKKITQYTTDMVLVKEWDSISHAMIGMGKNPRGSDISQCFGGFRKTAFGFIWKMN